MCNETHIRLVDAHPEGDRRHHDHAVVSQEAFLVLAARLGGQAGVIGQGVQALGAQLPSSAFHFRA